MVKETMKTKLPQKMKQKLQFKNYGFPLNFQGMDFIACLS